MPENYQRFRKPVEGEQFASEYDFPSALIQDLVSRNEAPILVQTLDLSVAGTKTVLVPGRGFVPYFFQTNTTNKQRQTAALISVSINSDGNISSQTLACKHNRGFRGTFVSLTLSWNAQVNTSVDFVIHRSTETPWMTDDTSQGSAISIDSLLPNETGQDGKYLTTSGGVASWGIPLPSGAILPFAGSAAPTGFLSCDGSAVSRTTYAALFAAIGTAHGTGNGTTTFNLPDYRGRFLRGVDGGAGNDPDRAARTAMATGGSTGDAVGSLQADQIASHSHSAFTGGQNGSAVGALNGWNGSSPTGSTSTSATGGNETRPKNANVLYIIKT